MKTSTKHLLLLLLFFSFYLSSVGSSISLQAPIFKNCSTSQDSVRCSEEKWSIFRNEAQQLVQSAIPYRFHDSTMVVFRVDEEGMIEIMSKIGFFSNEALDIVEKHVLRLSGNLSSSNQGTKFVLGLKFDLPGYYKTIPDLNRARNIPIFKGCESFNPKGQKACFNYFLHSLTSEMGSYKDEMEVDLYFIKGELKAIDVQNPSFYINTNNEIYSSYLKIAKRLLDSTSIKYADNFKVRFQYQFLIGDSLKKRKFRFKKLERLSTFSDPKWFTTQLFSIANIYYRTEPLKSKFILDNLQKYGFSDLTKVWNGEKFISIENLNLNLKIDPEKIGRNDSHAIPKGCEDLKSKEELAICFNKSMMSFVAQNFKFPEEARQMGIQGKVYINFCVEKNGSISSIIVAKGVDYYVDIEAIRIVSLLEDFVQPGFSDGLPIRKLYTLPFNLMLQ